MNFGRGGGALSLMRTPKVPKNEKVSLRRSCATNEANQSAK